MTSPTHNSTHLDDVRRRHRGKEATFHALLARSQTPSPKDLGPGEKNVDNSLKSGSRVQPLAGKNVTLDSYTDCDISSPPQLLNGDGYIVKKDSDRYTRQQTQTPSSFFVNSTSSHVYTSSSKKRHNLYDYSLSQYYTEIDRGIEEDIQRESSEYQQKKLFSDNHNPQEHSPIDHSAIEDLESGSRQQNSRSPVTSNVKDFVPYKSSHYDESSSNVNIDANADLSHGLDQQVESFRVGSDVVSQNKRIDLFESQLEHTTSHVGILRAALNQQLNRVAQLEAQLEPNDLHLASYNREKLQMTHEAMGEMKDPNTPTKHERNHMRRLFNQLLKDQEQMEQRYKEEKLHNARRIIEMEAMHRKMQREIEFSKKGSYFGDIIRNTDDNSEGKGGNSFHGELDFSSTEKGTKVANSDIGSVLPDESTASHSSDKDDRETEYEHHLSTHQRFWRNIILGVNDGLVSTFLLVATVTGGGLSTTDILLTACGGAFAGAISMCVGECVATKSQNKVMEGEIELKRHHLKTHNNSKLDKVNSLLQLIGITDEQEDIQIQLRKYYKQSPDALLKLTVALELGFVEEKQQSPLMVGLESCVLFLIGSIPSVVPFAFTDANPNICLIAAAVATCMALLVAGAIKAWAMHGKCLHAALENLGVAGVGGGFAYAVGMGFDALLHSS